MQDGGYPVNANDKIFYRDGYKYQLDKTWSHQISIKGYDVAVDGGEDPWCSLTKDGILTVKAGYAWDGPSGPTFDTKDFMRGSLAHDALYQLMREGKLPQSCREAADGVLKEICKEDGMGWFRLWYVYKGVRDFAASAAKRQTATIISAP